MNELHSALLVLLSWASTLSGYPMPDALPSIAYEQHAFFVEKACGGKECKAVGWYNDMGIIYLDEKYRYEEQDEFANSLLVHELVHYLQHQSGEFDPLSCADSLLREKEAYAVQNKFLYAALYSFLYIPPRPTACAY